MKGMIALAVAFVMVLSFACGGEEEQLTDGTAAPTATQAASATAVATPTASSTPSTAWKTFTNTKYGYSLQYPAGWLVNPNLSGIDPTTSNYVAFYNHEPPETGSEKPLPPDKLKIEIVVLENPQRLALDAWVADFTAQQPSEPTVLSSEPLSLGGTVAIRQVLSVGPFEFFTVFIGHGDRIYNVNGPQTNSALLPAYNQMLTTFTISQ